MRQIATEIAITGGGTGGVAAALAALRQGRRVVLTEETDWIGGQLTSQLVPPDEHRWIESFGCTQSYRQLRDDIREYYRRWFTLSSEARQNPNLNPGGASISRISHEPRVSLAVLQSYLLPYETSGQLQLLLGFAPVAATSEKDRVTSVTLKNSDGDETIVQAEYFLDATELGNLLELAGVEHVVGAEAQSETGEPHAPSEAQPHNQQAITHCFAISHHDGEDHTIERPDDYAFWREYQAPFWPDKNLSWFSSHPITGEAREIPLFDHVQGKVLPSRLWKYRQLREPQHHLGSSASITSVNWPQNDYWLGSLVGVSPTEKQKHLRGAKQLSLCLLYWLQTEAPRPDGQAGYPGLKLRPDITSTRDGFAKSTYVRESRRIRARFTVCEQHIALESRPDGPKYFDDSIGVGCYRIDLHPSTSGYCWRSMA